MTPVRAGVLVLLSTLAAHGESAAPLDRPETFVSRLGSDSSPVCLQTAPCRTFRVAQFRTRKGGVITCLDSGDFDEGSDGGVNITKSITIDCTGHVAMVDGIIMNGRLCPSCIGDPPADPENIVAIIRGLTIHGRSGGIGSVHFTVGKSLHIEKSTITSVAGSSFGATAGIDFAPSRGESRLHVIDTVISHSGKATGSDAEAGGGIIVKPTGTGAARVILNRVQVLQNTSGIMLDGTTSAGGIAMTITDSVSGGNARDGILAISKAGQSKIRLTLDRIRSLNNDAAGIRASGPEVVVRVNNSIITGNSNGLTIGPGAVIHSAGNNVVEGNANNGSFSAARIAPK